ncbi:SGNH/GDSL hydrolase family protein [Brevundimonas nasdae]|uniref:SGNH hydrolase-type esterase domain-containing protein n=1 Tax=Brevundimonas nasdae TaxID=172043 RepID=A0ABX8TJH3_9CAUL|nr:hypothetical protein [Brevundimonas nasdae]QYC10555.1 hypothetical protein KWG56_00585 [Brevundimonas nasdae]QYC13342.1 hypothetical protein KWG63_14140 [Brevundimonas nasdae]
MADNPSFAQRFARVYRDFNLDGVPASGANEPEKAAIRAIGAALDVWLAAASVGDLEAAMALLQPIADEATAARDFVALRLAPMSTESGWAILAVDTASKHAGGWRVDGTFEPIKFKSPAGAIDLDALAQAVRGRMFGSDGLGGLFTALTPEQGGGLAITDEAGRVTARVDGTGLLSLFKVLLSASTRMADQPDVLLKDRLLSGAIGGMLAPLPPESGYAFAVVGPDKKIGFGVPLANLPLTGRSAAHAARADYADRAGNVALRIIVCLGDSLTAGAGGTPYPTQLALIIGRAVVNMGIGGQGSGAIVARQGGDPTLLTVTANEIPAAVTPLAVTVRTISLLTNQGAQTIDGTLAGVSGALTRASDDTYSFTRKAAGAVRYCAPSTPFIPAQGVERQDEVWSIWIGRNDGTGNLATTTKAKVASAVAFLGHDRYFVLGVINKTKAGSDTSYTEGVGTPAYQQIVAYNNDQAARYGSRFVDIRRHLIDYGLADAGLTPTTRDIEDIAQDCIPTALLSDGLHLNTAGYGVIARRMATLLQSKGW